MNFEYQLQASDEKYFLNERHRKTNIIYFILFALFYLAINIPMMMKQFWIFFVIYIFYVLLLGIILWLCNFIFTWLELRMRQKDRKEAYANYHFSITKRGITQSVGTFKVEVLWKDIKKIKIRRNYIFVEPKREGIAFLFQKKTLGNQYDELVTMIKQYMKVDK